MDCPVCDGGKPWCETCRGTGDVPIHQCPNRTLDRVHFEIVQACIFAEGGALPDAGGWQDQAAAFSQAYGIVMRAVNECREQARQKAMRDAQRTQR